MNVLITGGAGFIGSYVTKLLLSKGYKVTILDNLDEQVHGKEKKWPVYLVKHKNLNLVLGDVRNRAEVAGALDNADAVIHLAAAVGVGQSMYMIEHYCSVNIMGSAILLEEIIKRKDKIKKILVASSMSIYGEGLYKNSNGDLVYPKPRSIAQMVKHDWELKDSVGNKLEPVPTPETKPLFPESVYAVNKRDQEEMFLSIGKAYSIPTVAFRMFNVYGAYQALSNPYTGVAAIFSNKLLGDEQPMIFEDGNQKRDFVHVEDIANAYAMALEGETVSDVALNLGSGESISVLEIAVTLSGLLGKNIQPVITNNYRDGDIRNCFADISLTKKILRWTPKWKFKEGITTMLDWLKQEKTTKTNNSFDELKKRGLVK